MDEFYCPICGAMDHQEDVDLPNDEGITQVWVRSCDCIINNNDDEE